MTLVEANVNTISCPADLIEDFRRENIMLSRGTTFMINDALFSSRSRRNLPSFKDVHRNGYHIETKNEDNTEYFYLTNVLSRWNQILESLPVFSSGLYYTFIHEIESHTVMAQKASDPKYFTLWHDRLGHPGSIMMRRIIEKSCGHPLKN